MNSQNIKTLLLGAKEKITVIGVSGIGDELLDFFGKENKSHISIHVLCESDNFLFSRSLISDSFLLNTRVSFSNLIIDQHKISNYASSETQSNIDIKVCYLDFPLRIVVIDTDVYVNNWILLPNNSYKKINEKDEDHNEIISYINLMLNENVGLKYSAPYKNKKGIVTEIIELFDEDRIRRGIFPRSSFYDSDFIKLVVWVFIFDRKGQLLIHKRATNAKDNQGMWDKSVGGHADYIQDVDTSRTVPREVIEELITDENIGNQFIKTNDSDIIFLGDWRYDKRGYYPFEEIKKLKDKWAFFKLPGHYRTTSPRILPDGRKKNNEVIADTYLFVLSDEISLENIDNFQNSSYVLIAPSQLKTVYDRSKNNMPVDDIFIDSVPLFTPDIEYALTSKLRKHLEDFSKVITETL